MINDNLKMDAISGNLKYHRPPGASRMACPELCLSGKRGFERVASDLTKISDTNAESLLTFLASSSQRVNRYATFHFQAREKFFRDASEHDASRSIR